MIIDLPPCAHEIAVYYEVPAPILHAIHRVEGGKPGLRVGPNRNGTFDLGPMQINTVHLDRLGAMGISEHEVLNNPCTNIAIGAWLLRDNYRRLGNWPNAIAAYNAGRNYAGTVGRRYAAKVMKVLASMAFILPGSSL